MKKALWAGLIVALFVSSGLGTFWLLEPDPWIQGFRVISVVTQVEGETTVIEVPTTPFATVLDDFTIQTLVRAKTGALVDRTDAVVYVPRVDYRFVTPRSLTQGMYEAKVRVGYQLNPLSHREQEFPLALIYVEERK